MIKLITIALGLLVAELVYIKLAKKKGITDIPNHRSAHSKPTIRGGGMVVVLAFIMYGMFYHFSNTYYFLLLSIVLVSTVSFIDDLLTLSSKIRILTHLIAFTIVFYSLSVIDFYSITTIIILISTYVFSIGYLNIYNFMDGINGMTFLNGLASYITLIFINKYHINFTDNNLLILVIIALVIFGYFNFRKKAVCFAGDVGSISIGFSLIYFTLKIYFKTYNAAIFLIFLVYLLDGGWTIVERIFRKENIFQPHKRHLYQLLANNFKIAHLKISFIYFLLQMLLNSVLVFLLLNNKTNNTILGIMVFITSIIYVFIKVRALKKVTV